MEPAWKKICGRNFALTSRKAIRAMKPAWEKVNGLKFQLADYNDAQGKPRPILPKITEE